MKIILYYDELLKLLILGLLIIIKKNNNDFNRNVMANLVSNIFDFNKIFKR